uniref:Uncharacterized protein n=1 Tax=Zea mays TaxID=4577 RepID=B6UEF4_MAIZE|nr:hypothetical protein [Zea mays]|eukprot:NP_001145462.1 uncharacterized protein LOC100278848 [Zea mays]
MEPASAFLERTRACCTAPVISRPPAGFISSLHLRRYNSPAQIDSSTTPVARLPSPWVSSQTGLLKQFNPHICSFSSVLVSLISVVSGYSLFICVIFSLDKIGKESLKVRDHIYSWKAAWVYAHHGDFFELKMFLALRFSYLLGAWIDYLDITPAPFVLGKGYSH